MLQGVVLHGCQQKQAALAVLAANVPGRPLLRHDGSLITLWLQELLVEIRQGRAQLTTQHQRSQVATRTEDVRAIRVDMQVGTVALCQTLVRYGWSPARRTCTPYTPTCRWAPAFSGLPTIPRQKRHEQHVSTAFQAHG